MVAELSRCVVEQNPRSDEDVKSILSFKMSNTSRYIDLLAITNVFYIIVYLLFGNLVRFDYCHTFPIDPNATLKKINGSIIIKKKK